MNAQERIELMHAVLDCEATPEQARSLAGILAVDAKARAEFEELKALFEGLKAVNQAHVPEGLAASVMAGIPERRDPLPASSGVIGQSLKASSITSARASAKSLRVSRSGPRFKGEDGSERKPGISGTRKFWLGAGLAAAVTAIVVTSGIVEFPSSGKQTSGAVVPVPRDRVEQSNATDSKSGTPSGSSTAAPVAGGVGDAARGDAVGGNAVREDAARGDAGRGSSR
jgi:hypothetical protein